MTPKSLDEWIDRAIEADAAEVKISSFVDSDKPSGPPLNAEEIEAALLSLAQWQRPEVFQQAVNGLSSRCGSSDWFNRPQLKFLHDAYVLASFARLLKVDAVRIAEKNAQWPDGFIRVGDSTHNIEVTSTHGGRKLGKEYREVVKPTLDPVENWVKRADSISKFLDEVIGAKSRKRYSAPCWLVVYLNINEYDVRQRETEAEIARIKALHLDQFEAISVLWKERLY